MDKKRQNSGNIEGFCDKKGSKHISPEEENEFKGT
jgi:hypothetical protein